MQSEMEVQQLVMNHQLGEQQAAYKSSPLTFILFLIIFLLFSISLFYIFSVSTTHSSFFAGLIIATGFILPLGVLLALTLVQIRDLNVYVFVHEYGLLYRRATTIRVIRWDQIAFVWHKVVRSKSTSLHSYQLRCLDGSTLEFRNAIPNVRVLGKTIEQETARYLFPAARDAFSSGQSLAFGRLRVQQSGLLWRDRQLLWQELQSFTVHEDIGVINIKKSDRWFRWASLQTRQIPNIEVLKALIQPYIKL